MIEIRSAAPPPRLAYLDSLRGVAALLVVIYHCWIATDARQRLGLLEAPAWTDLTMGSLALRGMAAFFDMGRAAVMMFFVLSGFVLALSLSKARTSYAAFMVKRLCRIYPAFLVIMVASYGLHLTLGVVHSGTSPLMSRLVAPDLSPLQLAEGLTLWGTMPSMDLDLVTWSLVHEMRISWIFPLLWVWVQRAGGPAVMICTLLSIGCTLGLYAANGRVAYGFVETTLPQTLAVTLYFSVFFICGAWLAVERGRLTARLRTLSTGSRMALLALAGLSFFKGDHGAQALSTPIVDYVHGAASLVVIALLLSTGRFSRALSGAVLRWLGRISYGLYLVHLPVLYVVSQTLAIRNPLLAGCSVVAASLALAELLARSVEFPGIALGARIAARFGSMPKRAPPSTSSPT